MIATKRNRELERPTYVKWDADFDRENLWEIADRLTDEKQQCERMFFSSISGLCWQKRREILRAAYRLKKATTVDIMFFVIEVLSAQPRTTAELTQMADVRFSNKLLSSRDLEDTIVSMTDSKYVAKQKARVRVLKPEYRKKAEK